MGVVPEVVPSGVGRVGAGGEAVGEEWRGCMRCWGWGWGVCGGAAAAAAGGGARRRVQLDRVVPGARLGRARG